MTPIEEEQVALKKSKYGNFSRDARRAILKERGLLGKHGPQIKCTCRVVDLGPLRQRIVCPKHLRKRYRALKMPKVAKIGGSK